MEAYCQQSEHWRALRPRPRFPSPSLLELPPELDQALKGGRCTSPRTLRELSKLHHEEPERVKMLVAGDAEITRTAVTAARTIAALTSWSTLLAQSNAACARLEQSLAHLNKAEHGASNTDLAALRRRIADLPCRLT